MNERKAQMRAAVWAFLLTIGILTALLCGVRVECVTRRSLYGTAVISSDWQQQAATAAESFTAVLPTSTGVLMKLLQAESRAVTSLIK